MRRLIAQFHAIAQKRTLAVLLLVVPLFGNVGGASAAILQQVAPFPAVFVDGVDYDVMSYSGTKDVTASVQGVDLSSLTSGCNAADFAGFPAGYIALIERGFCTFADKATNAYAAGASGVLIMNDEAGLLSGSLLSSFTLDIPVIGLTQALGQQLESTTGLIMRMLVTEADALPPAAQVPEPATLALLTLGLAGLGFSRRKQ